MKHHEQVDRARRRAQQAYESVREASIKYNLGGYTDEQFACFLLEHYKAQMAMAELIAYWPYTPVVCGDQTDVLDVETPPEE